MRELYPRESKPKAERLIGSLLLKQSQKKDPDCDGLDSWSYSHSISGFDDSYGHSFSNEHSCDLKYDYDYYDYPMEPKVYLPAQPYIPPPAPAAPSEEAWLLLDAAFAAGLLEGKSLCASDLNYERDLFRALVKELHLWQVARLNGSGRLQPEGAITSFKTETFLGLDDWALEILIHLSAPEVDTDGLVLDELVASLGLDDDQIREALRGLRRAHLIKEGPYSWSDDDAIARVYHALEPRLVQSLGLVARLRPLAEDRLIRRLGARRRPSMLAA